MIRLLGLLLAVLALAPAGCKRRAPEPDNTPATGGVAVAPAPRPPEPNSRIAPMPHFARADIAPMPHEPHEADLTKVDLGFDTNPEPTIFDIDRLPELVVPNLPGAISPLDPLDPLGAPAVVPPPAGGLDLPPGGAFGPKGDPKTDPKPAGGLELDPKLSTYAGRKGATKEKLLKEYGGNAASEKAVALGLAWLAKQQKQDGSWAFDGGAQFKTETTAATGLALLAFLGAGETHKDAKGKYQKNVAAGVAFLTKSCPTTGANAGKFSAQIYSQGIATLALVEAYAMTNDPALKAPAQAALNYIQRSQAKNGSWGYTSGANGDTSITGWQLQALFAGKQAKLVVDNKVIKSAVQFLDFVAAGKQKAVYGYNNNAGAMPGTALTASGLWSRHTIDDWGPKHPGLAEGVTGLLKRAPAAARIDTYHLYYATMVVWAHGGEEWKTWNEGPKGDDGTRKGGLRDVLIEAQVTKDGLTLGSWNPDNGQIGIGCGRLGTTALCVINLECYYRHLPLYRAGAAPKPGDPKVPDKK